ncbi:cytochrome c oxidase assembly protein COX16-domain-containing protein [Leucosporidium creatinivorum]|uniref:Cytochrome c oxidase assembly protein COX16, mitochondrial n=1 Tax=Leucosporidium creatinivorum TaxID=106004 RepID=A0A1Y2E5E8_9BASI|nr:cytochrome c oxidase assembly protein COX16-domain-containing protein [Leucosporidium creatinivorum]
MPSFSSRPIKPSAFTLSLRKHPFALFGLPFIATIVIASWGLSSFTQTRYDLRDEKVHAVTKEEELGMKKGRRKFDVREEYYRLQAKGNEMGESDDWENKRVERLPGQDEWGMLPVAKK